MFFVPGVSVHVAVVKLLFRCLCSTALFQLWVSFRLCWFRDLRGSFRFFTRHQDVSIYVFELLARFSWHTWRSYSDALPDQDHEAEDSRPKQIEAQPDANVLNLQNKTLGFQEIRVISLPECSDKRHAWAVTASLFGFEYNISYGVASTLIS